MAEVDCKSKFWSALYVMHSERLISGFGRLFSFRILHSTVKTAASCEKLRFSTLFSTVFICTPDIVSRSFHFSRFYAGLRALS